MYMLRTGRTGTVNSQQALAVSVFVGVILAVGARFAGRQVGIGSHQQGSALLCHG